MFPFAPELVRPDNIMRSGIIQPFNVVSQSPVRFARHEIDPFIQAIRPAGAMHPTASGAMNGGFGIVSPEVLRSLSAAESNKSWGWIAGGTLIGVVAGFLLGKYVF